LVDEHVPHAVAQALRRRGIDVLTASDAELLGATDEECLARSLAERRVLITHDDDFLRLHDRGVQHAGIVYAEQGTRSIGQLVAGLVLIYEVLEPGEMAGRLEFL
jgi:predicted nuclease of predicted toxin-antitoxin system